MAEMSRSTVSGEVPSTSKVTGRTKTEWSHPVVTKLDRGSVQNSMSRVPYEVGPGWKLAEAQEPFPLKFRVFKDRVQ